MIKKTTKKDIFNELNSWDIEFDLLIKKSNNRAWLITYISLFISIVSLITLAMITPLKSIEPFIVRVDNSTGMVDVISVLNEKKGKIKKTAQVVLDQYFLSTYVKERESYLYQTRNKSREVVALFSNSVVQNQYAEFTDPKKNSNAPIVIYNNSAEVFIKIKTITVISEEKDKNNKLITTSLIRFTRQIKRAGESYQLEHYAVTVIFTYNDSPMSIKKRLINPLGFQVNNYRINQENFIEEEK